MKFLIVIDMQNDFISGPLAAEFDNDFIKRVKDEIIRCQDNDYTIIFTQDTHSHDTYLSTNEGKHLPIEHCIRGTEGWRIISELMDLTTKRNSFTYPKPYFATSKWSEILKDLFKGDVDEIELIGVCTDICVISNAIVLKSIFPEIKISVKSSCCAGTTKENHDKAIDIMKICQIDIED